LILFSPATYPTPAAFKTTPATVAPAHLHWLDNCYADGEASAAVKQQVDAGPAIVSTRRLQATSTTRSTTTGIPTKGVARRYCARYFAGVGGDVNFIRTTGVVRMYYELISDIVSVLHLQGGYVTGWGDKDLRC
jgi:outer membrane protein insertion porin family